MNADLRYQRESASKNSRFRQQIAVFASILMNLEMLGFSLKRELHGLDLTEERQNSQT